jgi:gamma-glutamyl hercynylcysteine S-oxide synthase
MSTNIIINELNLINDEAIEQIKHDSLDFDTYAQVLAEAVLETPSPFTLGIYAEAGKGKTSLLKFIFNEISLNKSKQNIINVFYDAWIFENSYNPLLDLLNVIEKNIKKTRFEHDETIIMNILDYIKFIKNAISNINTLNSEKNTQKGMNTQSNYFEIYELLKSLEKLLSNENYKIIIYIDNLDKCKAKNILGVFESINLIFDLKGFSFIFAAEKDLLEKQLNTTIKNSKDYLEKIVQLPFYLPSFKGKVTELMNSFYSKNDSNINLENSIKNIIQSISSLETLTPRLIIRLINRIKVCAKIYSKLNPNTKLSNENILSLFSISCILEELFRDFHNILIKNDSFIKYLIGFMQNENFNKEELSLNINILNSDKKLMLVTIENNFNILKMIFNTEQGKYWLENKTYRIGTYEFLKSNNEIVEDMQVDLIPKYKTDFLDNSIIMNGNTTIDPKEFILIPEQNFEMSKYVVINKWFEEFILSGGYNNLKYWNNIAANIWLMKNKIHSLDEKYSKMIEKESEFFNKKYKEALLKENFNSDLQPVVYITYYEAEAFCKYLSDIDEKYEYQIPTKEQWEYVAKAGIEKRVYPWGNNWNSNYCNNGTTQLNRTSEIGMFPQGNSKHGISDIVGNVWVWTSSLEGNEYNYLKGGSWNFSDSSYFKVSGEEMTFYNKQSYQHYDIGFFCIRKQK